jgi:hypothetical protein
LAWVEIISTAVDGALAAVKIGRFIDITYFVKLVLKTGCSTKMTDNLNTAKNKEYEYDDLGKPAF